jgi:hypothetical protein
MTGEACYRADKYHAWKVCQDRSIQLKILIERIGFNLNASRSDWATAVGVERIQDKTRWTKALGKAVTVVYGDCKVEIGQRRCSRTNAGQFLTQQWIASEWLNVIESRSTRREVRKRVEPLRGLWQRAIQTAGLLCVDRSSRRIPWRRNRQVGKEEQSSLLA